MSKKKSYTFFLWVFLLILPALAAQGQSGITDRLKGTVYFLASDSLCGRQAGSGYEHEAANYIADEFKIIGLKKFIKNSFFQPFEFTLDSFNKDTSQNVLGWINNHAEKTIIIGAHYDHIGMGGRYSRSIGKKAVHPGADDNASGVALMLELARNIKETKLKKTNIVFAAFGAHEPGLFGSKFFVRSNIVDTSDILFMINLDMVGRFDSVTGVFICESAPADFADSLLNVKPIADYKIKYRELTMGDQTPFQQKHIPVLRYTTGMHDDYHTVNDKAEKINYNGMTALFYYLMKLLSVADQQKVPLPGKTN